MGNITRLDENQFAAAYADPDSGITTGPRPPGPSPRARPGRGHAAGLAELIGFMLLPARNG